MWSGIGTARAAGCAPPGVRNRLADLVWLRSLTGGDRTYVEHVRSDRSLSFAALQRSVVGWTSLLSDLGVDVGGTVGVVAADPIDFSIVFLSAMAAGRVVAPFDAGAPDPELDAACRRVRPAVVLADRPAPAGAGCEWLELPAGSFQLLAADVGPARSAGVAVVDPQTGGGQWAGSADPSRPRRPPVGSCSQPRGRPAPPR